MSHSATRSASSRRGRRAQRGSSLIVTIMLTSVAAMLVLVSFSYARSTTTQTQREGRSDLALQVADAGVSRYISRLVEDPRYFDHFIDQAEDPRIDPSGVVHAPGTAWTPGVTWTYAAGGPTDLDAAAGRALRAVGVLAADPAAAGRLRPGDGAVDGAGGPRPAEPGDALRPEPDPPDVDRRLPDDLERHREVRLAPRRPPASCTRRWTSTTRAWRRRPPTRSTGPARAASSTAPAPARRAPCSRAARTTRRRRRHSSRSSRRRSTSRSSPSRAWTSRTPPRRAAPPSTTRP